MKRVTTGLKKLDALIEGGFPENTAVLLSGGPGSGKTLLGLNFLMEGARKGEKCCYVSLSESREELLRACEAIESLNDISRHINKNLAIEHIQLGENITIKKFIEIISSYPKIDRLVIDNVNKLLMFAENKRYYRIHLAELVRHLRNIGCSLILCETSGENIDSGNDEAFEVDGVMQIIFLDLEEKPMRVLSIHKMRYTSFEPKIPHELVIDSKGIEMTETKVI